MSYDLVFWRQRDNSTRPPKAVLDDLAKGNQPGDLEDVPLDDLLGAILSSFKGAAREPNGTREWIVWEASDASASLQVEWSPKHVWATLRPLLPNAANRLIEIGASCGCPLYDPQIDQRFVRRAAD